MDPATLYVLLTMANGDDRAIERPFATVEACEEFVARVMRPQSDKATIQRYECVAHSRTQSVPSWYLPYASPRRIQGIPLSDVYRPKQ